MGKISSGSDGKSRAERKFEKKMQFYENVRTVVTTNAAIKKKNQKIRSRQKKLKALKAYDLSSLTECLRELKSPSKPAELKINCKRRNGLVLKESDRLKTVLNHPVFQSDPLAAIYQHLQNTQPVTAEKSKKKDSKTKKTNAEKKKSKAPQSMEI